ncbi:hypothetical protein NITHO_300002 [Nitrolancea hollandica Lb]|uniref:Uncharacterized protein n=1 Tax=Nitrolancea hollandica Lb TaxID=1129897 RepID=I4EH38_9BACT|nr:hypothetical protein NITHO_300002 [Nitrolancea hollandica Lb]
MIPLFHPAWWHQKCTNTSVIILATWIPIGTGSAWMASFSISLSQGAGNIPCTYGIRYPAPGLISTRSCSYQTMTIDRPLPNPAAS